MITSFEHKFDIGDTVFLTFYSRGKYRATLEQFGYLLPLWLRLINTAKWLVEWQMKH